jgi:hypothetical protein
VDGRAPPFALDRWSAMRLHNQKSFRSMFAAQHHSSCLPNGDVRSPLPHETPSLEWFSSDRHLQRALWVNDVLAATACGCDANGDRHIVDFRARRVETE